MKQHNILQESSQTQTVRSVYVCPDTTCERTIVTYRDNVKPTYHSAGLPNDVFVRLRNANISIVPTHCDHHGGVNYTKFSPQEGLTQLDRSQTRILTVLQMGGMTLGQTTQARNQFAEAGIDPTIFEGEVY